MSWTRRFIWIFWIFVVTMLLWQCYRYNAALSQPSAQPRPDHFFFYQQNGKQAVAPVEHAGPFVEQTGFSVDDNTPTSASFTCRVTLKNSGKAKAVNVEVCVRPYKGALSSDADDGGRNDSSALPENNPRAQINLWLTFPDLDAGQSSTQSIVFMKQGAGAFGSNPKPEIVYEPEKKK